MTHTHFLRCREQHGFNKMDDDYICSLCDFYIENWEAQGESPVVKVESRVNQGWKAEEIIKARHKELESE